MSSVQTAEVRSIAFGRNSFKVVIDWPGEGEYWDRFSDGKWELGTLVVIKDYVRPGQQFLDIGAYIGPISLAAAAMGATVEAYEPDEMAFKRLTANVEENPKLRITIHKAGVWTSDGEAVITPGPFGFGDSMSSVVVGKTADSQPIKVIDGSRLQAADFVKIDIEGAEFELIPHIRGSVLRNRPDLLLSTHCFEEPTSALGRIRSRLRQGCKMASLFWCLREYKHKYCVFNDRSDLVPLDFRQLIRSVFGLSEKEFFFTARSSPDHAPG